MDIESLYNQIAKENIELLTEIKKHIKWNGPESVNYGHVGNQSYVNEQLQELARFMGLSLGDKKQE